MNLLIITQKIDEEDDNLGFFVAWVKEFAGKCENVFVVANFVGEYNLPANVKVFSLGKEKNYGRIRRYFKFFKFSVRLMSKSDAVFVHMIPAWVILVWPIALVYRKKIYLWYTHKSVTLSLRIAEKLVSKIFTASRESCRLNSKKIIVTGHGIDINFFVPNDRPDQDAGALRKDFDENKNQLKLLAVGRITESKDYNFLIDVLAELKKMKTGVNYALDIVGDTITSEDVIYKKRLEDKIKFGGLGGLIRFLGAKTYSQMPEAYNFHDILIHASKTGSIDKVILEAMACGLLVITTSEAFKNILPEKYFLDKKDVKTFAEKVISLKLDRGSELRELVVKNHNLEKLINKILENIDNE